MSFLLMLLVSALVFPSVVMLASFLLNTRSINNMEKLTPFECGFDPLSSARIPFSLQFFLLAVLFLVFDIEIALLMPVPMANLMSPNIICIVALFCSVLIVGLYHEWNENSLEWK